MQRSRSSVSSEITTKNHRHIYNVFLSFIVIWWLFFPVLIGHSDNNHRDGSGVVPVGDESTWDEAEQLANEGFDSGIRIHNVSTVSKDFDLDTCDAISEAKCTSKESRTVDEENVNDEESVEHNKEKLEGSDLGPKLEKDDVNNDRLSHVALVGLDEFKSKQLSSTPKGKPAGSESSGGGGGVVHRVEAGGTEYNYASASKGAKVLDFNKEAKGASYILGKDKDKYLRNPCSAEAKFVVIELSEETLVDTIEIANFEHYSSNVRDFVVLGSLVYPTDKWVHLGNMTAKNVKHAQRFILDEPKWVRYLKLNLLNHYGSGFYCTLSAVGVYGMDAVEQMVEDLISVHEEVNLGHAPTTSQRDEPAVQRDDWDFDGESAPESAANLQHQVPKTNGRYAVPDDQPQQVGRMTGDSALKVLLQKVRSMDLSLTVLERYLEELNSRYGRIFKELDDEIAAKDVLLYKYKDDIEKLVDNKEIMAENVADLIGWKSLVSSQVNNLVDDNVILRTEIARVLKNQVYMETKGVVILLVGIIFGCIALLKLVIDLVVNLFRIQSNSGKFMHISSSSLVMLLSSSIIVIMLL
ncbi:hypothetical protein MKW94_027736 [Papaver nudicaule]|uniref:SUN domain-containing protein n=1 Tax=Papaver nudicaule TaxID=74823 RepID=A0AA42AVL3_PAPNU|nr:hypothetical protein [Papaver nudicaule]